MKPEDVLDFWFGEYPDNLHTPARQARLWWSKEESVDKVIRDRFERLLVQLVNGHRRQWTETPRGRLAAIIVLDQFSRNIYRDTRKAFDQDSMARFWCLEGINHGHDKELLAIERLFFYMPLEHSESDALQNLSVEKIGGLENEVDEKSQPVFAELGRYAREHYEVIKKFGRYPHRNAILGRESTQAELEYLSQPGSGF